MKIATNILKFIFILILTLCIIILIASKICTSTILSEQYIKDKLEETDYYTEIYNIVESNLENYIGQSGLDEEVFKNIITKEKVKEDTNKIIENIYENKEQEINADEIKTNLNNNIVKSLNGKSLSSTQKNALNEYLDKIANEYTSTILHTKYEKNISNKMLTVNDVLPKVNKFCMLLATISLVMLLIFNIKEIEGLISQIGVSILTPGIFYFILYTFINKKVKVNNLTIFNEAFSKTAVNILNEILNNIQKLSSELIICGLVMIIVGTFIKSTKANENK